MSFTYPSLPWLLEKDNAGVRFLTLRDLVGLPTKSIELEHVKKEAYTKGPIGEILKHMNPEGYWQKPGAGYNPKYSSTAWSLILLSQLGAQAKDDKRIEKACNYYLDHAFTKDSSISYNGNPSGVVNCLIGNMCAALTILGFEDERIAKAYKLMAKSVTGKIEKYYSILCGPGFLCGPNAKLPCAWGAVKVVLAFGQLPPAKRTPEIDNAIKKGVEFLLSVDPLKADYPTRNNIKPSPNWWKFGFPVFYITDLLQVVEALTSVGYGHDPRIKNTIDYIKQKQDEKGRWLLEYDYSGKTWYDFGIKKQPNKWVTYRVLKILKSLN